MSRKSIIYLGFAWVILSLLAACAPVMAPTPGAPQRHPFSLNIAGEDGISVSWEGYPDGYRPGTSETTHLVARNETDRPWRGHLCVQLLRPEPSPRVFPIASRDFDLEPGTGFEDAIRFELPADLTAGVYGLALVVHKPTGPIVDVIAIQVGDGGEGRPRDAWPTEMALEACALPTRAVTDPTEGIVAQAKADLAQRLDISPELIQVQSVEATEFSDTSLGVPEPGQFYAQVITPGHVIRLMAKGQVFTYHAGGGRLVAVLEDDKGQPPGGRVLIDGVAVSHAQVVVRGKSTLPEGSCVSTELWADGALQTWWPSDACAPVRQGEWELAVLLDAGQALRAGVQYMLRAYQPGGPNIVATFPFDLTAPRSPSREPENDPALLLPDAAEVLDRASADLDGDGAAELVFLAGFGGAPDRLGYDSLALLVLSPSASAEAVAGYELAWHSDPLVGERAESLEVRDINGDGHLEILCLQAMGAAGQTLQVFAWSEGDYGLLYPHGGRFDGQDAFSENAVRLEDVDGDGLAEILAGYGPAARLTDVYGWDGRAYVYRQTLGD